MKSFEAFLEEATTMFLRKDNGYEKFWMDILSGVEQEGKKVKVERKKK